VRDYYEARAAEYDDWYLGVGLHAARDRPGWHRQLAGLCSAVAALPPADTLDVACGTGYLTRLLRGRVTGLDVSPAMLAIAASRAPDGVFVQADATALPFADGRFRRVFAGHFYGHLEPDVRDRFLAEAARVARELVVVDSALRRDGDMAGMPLGLFAPPSDRSQAERMQPRQLRDGSRHAVYKRYFTPDRLAAELGGETLLAGDWFVMVRAPLPPPGGHSSRATASR